MNPALIKRLELLEAAKGTGLDNAFWEKSYEASFRGLCFDPSNPSDEERASFEEKHGTIEDFIRLQRGRRE